ncbi:hypothetical protein HanRHA438_Chr04g0187181 [Helianthus annuus]|nr:hypothetical protein HanRHA438_Chr04g0187181 [Helianthus annuus]
MVWRALKERLPTLMMGLASRNINVVCGAKAFQVVILTGLWCIWRSRNVLIMTRIPWIELLKKPRR